MLGAANLVLWLVFLVDYLARVFLAMDRWLFIRTHVLALLVVAVPFLRPLRLLMLVAVVGQFIQRAKGGVRGRVLAFVLLATVVLMSTAAVLVYGFERTAEGSSIVTLGDAVWWAIATVTTVGYGDSIPVTPQGRTVAAVLMVVGIGLVGTSRRSSRPGSCRSRRRRTSWLSRPSRRRWRRPYGSSPTGWPSCRRRWPACAPTCGARRAEAAEPSCLQRR